MSGTLQAGVVVEAGLVLDARARLGEGPVWDVRQQVLWWVDIVGRAVHRFTPGDGSDRTTNVAGDVGAVVIREGGGLVAALPGGFWTLDPETGHAEQLAAVEEDRPGNRMNDGKCDPAGRFLAGTMAFDTRPGAGSLYRLDAHRSVTRLVAGVTISNGLGWSPDGRTLYYIDTPTRRVDAFSYDPMTRAIADRRSVLEIEDGAGDPDRMTVDRDGCLWVALWGGWAVRAYRPDGTLARIVRLPVAQVTSCTFGGADFGDLYITTAWDGLGAEERQRQPLAGGVFRTRPGACGLPPHRYLG
ncbi:MAG: SMP-30/gluconolactonase/LRE family protein [Chloroflexi bacterium]|nr:SMP-30/gluconolactonase/LRE family protein [Chloroflexota bacterium]